MRVKTKDAQAYAGDAAAFNRVPDPRDDRGVTAVAAAPRHCLISRLGASVSRPIYARGCRRRDEARIKNGPARKDVPDASRARGGLTRELRSATGAGDVRLAASLG